MKVVILAGGLGTRIAEETGSRPKPMIEIGDRPLLWHIMKLYSHHGIDDFIICAGYKGYMIKEYFLNYEAMNNDFTICLGNKHQLLYHGAHEEQDFRVTLDRWKVGYGGGLAVKLLRSVLFSVHGAAGVEGFNLSFGGGWTW